MLKFFKQYFLKTFRSKMTETSPLNPPDSVLKMTVWQPELFNKTVVVPYLDVPVEHLSKVPKKLKDKFLKLPHLQPIQKHSENGLSSKRLLLHPDLVKSFEDIAEFEKDVLVGADSFGKTSVDLTVENFLPQTMLRAVLKFEEEGLSSHSHVGHIIHVNLLPYKAVIGQILLRKKDVKLVVNKTSNIDNTFRNFEMEIIAQKNDEVKPEDFIVEVRENGIRYKFDFSKVYWNPRLSTEHQKMVDLLVPGDLVYDVFAGVGPFSVPAAKKSIISKKNPLGIKVYGNDLNPDSYKWLAHNFKMNKIPDGQFRCFNKDGKDFILQEIRSGIIDYYKDTKTDRKIHIFMNLPAIAIEFLTHFKGIIHGVDQKAFVNIEKKSLPYVHVYCFSTVDDVVSDVRERCADQFDGKELVNLAVDYVRSVAPHKEMMRASFQLSMEVMTNETLAETVLILLKVGSSSRHHWSCKS